MSLPIIHSIWLGEIITNKATSYNIFLKKMDQFHLYGKAKTIFGNLPKNYQFLKRLSNSFME